MAVLTNEKDILKALLDTEDEVQKEVYMSRFQANFVIRAIDGKLLNSIQEQCTYMKKGKNGKSDKELDEQKFQSMIIEKACVVPNFGSQALLDKYKVFEPYEVIERRLLAGELAKLSSEIMDISGFGDEEEAIEEVKN
ncbi:MAG: phage tail assembly chaperone [Bacillota bacterium]